MARPYIVAFATAILAAGSAINSPAQAQSTELTPDRLTEMCRPQLQAIIPWEIKSFKENAADYRSNGRPADAERVEGYIKDIEANGVQSVHIQYSVRPGWRETDTVAQLLKRVAEYRKYMAEGGYWRSGAPLSICKFKARVAELQGQKAKAVLASPSSASKSASAPISAGSTVGGVEPTGIADNGGRVAEKCAIAEPDKSSRWVLANHCGAPISVGWCAGAECQRGHGNQNNIPKGLNVNLPSVGPYQVGACYGFDTIHSVPGSNGKQFRCTAPL